MLSVGGGVVELAQHFRLAPGVGSLTDLTAEVGGIAAAVGLMLAAFAASGVAQQARRRVDGQCVFGLRRRQRRDRNAVLDQGAHLLGRRLAIDAAILRRALVDGARLARRS